MTDKMQVDAVSTQHKTSLPSRLFEQSLALYRRTIKRSYALHVITHWIVSRTVIPLLETQRRFKTVPDDPFWFRLELLLKRHEYETVQQLQALLKQGDIVLDIGAHIGYYSRIFGDLVGTEGRVLAFEPHPRTFTTLRRNTRRQMHIQLHQVAASDIREETELFDYLMMSASGSLHYDQTLAALQREQATEYAVAPRMENFEPRVYTIQAVVLDDYLRTLGISQVNLIKMDIEGAELAALRGLQQTIKNSPNLYLIMEFNPKALRAFELDPVHVIPMVLEMGFATAHAIQPDGRLQNITTQDDAIRIMTAELEENLSVINLLFAR